MGCWGVSVQKNNCPKGTVHFRRGRRSCLCGHCSDQLYEAGSGGLLWKPKHCAHIALSEVFGGTYACAGVSALLISIVADEDSACILIDCRRITASWMNACVFHSRVIFNLLWLVASNNLMFDQRVEVTSKRTTQEKLMAYLLN